jgi:flagellin-specific chaperone FliS
MPEDVPSTHAARAYLEAKVLAASPGERLLVTYDEAVRASDNAREAAASGDHDGERAAQAKLTQSLLLLIRAVNPTPDPLLAERLLTLYQWCLARLSCAREEGPSAYSKVREVLDGLRSAFAKAHQAVQRDDRIPPG